MSEIVSRQGFFEELSWNPVFVDGSYPNFLNRLLIKHTVDAHMSGSVHKIPPYELTFLNSRYQAFERRAYGSEERVYKLISYRPLGNNDPHMPGFPSINIKQYLPTETVAIEQSIDNQVSIAVTRYNQAFLPGGETYDMYTIFDGNKARSFIGNSPFDSFRQGFIAGELNLPITI